MARQWNDIENDLLNASSAAGLGVTIVEAIGVLFAAISGDEAALADIKTRLIADEAEIAANATPAPAPAPAPATPAAAPTAPASDTTAPAAAPATPDSSTASAPGTDTSASGGSTSAPAAGGATS